MNSISLGRHAACTIREVTVAAIEVAIGHRERELAAREQRVVEREDGQLEWEVARENEFARRVKEREAT